MKAEEALFFQGRDNWSVIALPIDGVALTFAQLSVITRVQLEIDSKQHDGEGNTIWIVADSDDTPDAFDWPMAGAYAGKAVNGIGVNLDLAGLQPFAQTGARLVIYDPDHERGIVWSDLLLIEYKV
jgi:hypothetical protein